MWKYNFLYSNVLSLNQHYLRLLLQLSFLILTVFWLIFILCTSSACTYLNMGLFVFIPKWIYLTTIISLRCILGTTAIILLHSCHFLGLLHTMPCILHILSSIAYSYSVSSMCSEFLLDFLLSHPTHCGPGPLCLSLSVLHFSEGLLVSFVLLFCVLMALESRALQAVGNTNCQIFSLRYFFLVIELKVPWKIYSIL